MTRIFLLGLLLFTLSCSNSTKNNHNALFSFVPSNESGIDFTNAIPDSDTLNILTYEYMYNGGGVAIADFDQDSLQDILFTGNLEPNHLYHNHGNLEFEDISESSNIAAQGYWCHGASVADINQDGYPDVLVATSKSKEDRFRHNLLFINQYPVSKRISFIEESASYGLSDAPYSLHSAFIDYDNDNDLDLIVINNRIYKSRNPSEFRKLEKDTYIEDRIDILYRNDWSEELGHPVFTNVSTEAGITIPGYSLGVNVCDINEDGWQDIYISNDFLSDDILYLNQQDGTFEDAAKEYFKHTSQTAMGNDIVDIDNNGLLDVFTVDMMPSSNERKKTLIGPTNYTNYLYYLSFGHMQQYTRNTLQLNQGIESHSGQPLFSEIAMQSGIEATDWSWAPVINDFDRDGFKDIYITNGFPKDITDRDFGDYQANYHAYLSKDKMLEVIPEVKLSNYMYRNKGGVQFEDVTQEWGVFDPSFSNGSAYSDLDNDGDLDLVVNNINHPAYILRNNSQSGNYLKIKLKGIKPNIDALGAKIYYKSQHHYSMIEHSPYRGYLSSMDHTLFIGLGDDSLVNLTIKWPNGQYSEFNDLSANQTLEVDQSNSQRILAEPELKNETLLTKIKNGIDDIVVDRDFPDYNYEPLLLHKFSQFGPGLAVADVNNDGLDDIYICGSSNEKAQLYIQNMNGSLVRSKQSFDEVWTKEELSPLFFDVDQDGDFDLYVGCGSNQANPGNEFYTDVFYVNNNGHFEEISSGLNLPNTSTTTVKAADYDQDGDLDLFIGSRVRPWSYPLADQSYILRNDSEGTKIAFTIDKEQSAIDELGLVSDALWTDVDQDGWVDLFIVGEWMSPTLLLNQSGKLVKSENGLRDYSGWWNSIVGADFDNDGDIDYVLGNHGTNTFLRASPSYPIELYADDFDDNGQIDPLTFLYFPNHEGKLTKVSFHGRDDLAKQLVRIKRQFNSNHEFASIGIDSILSKQEQEDALHLVANELSSAYIENLGNGKFHFHKLPLTAQIAPIFGGLPTDVDNDGHIDILLIGNDHGAHPLIGHMDASNGILLKGDGEGQFKPVTIEESGFCVKGDGKAFVNLIGNDGQVFYMASQNNNQILTFSNSDKHEIFKPENDDVRIECFDKNGDLIRTSELYYGDGFLSQSSRKLIIPQHTVMLKITKFNGNTRITELSISNAINQ